MSIGAGHVWRTTSLGDVMPSASPDVAADTYMLECVHCKRTRYTLTATVKRWFNPPKRGKNFARGSFRLHNGRPLGTCKAGTHTAQRRAAGEAEIRATLDAFE